MRDRRRVAAFAAATGLAAACAATALTAGPAVAATETATAQRAIASRPTTKEAWTARVLLPVHARNAPRVKARKIVKLSVTAPYNGGANVLMVLGARVNREGVWYKVRLTSRPNDAAGWIPAEAVQVKKTPWRVVVHLGARTMDLLRSGKRVGSWKVAVGTPANPTPTGRFAVSEVVKQRNPSGFFGTYIITLSAHSENLSEFDGGDGRVALHGTNQPGLLGQAVSHGCVRLDNNVATRLGRNVPPGSPVDILN
ncbi:MAG TPA: L,D-transpeptidase [Miltoncostaea sp.]|nr:L,D-transpeptidase [Miltoncostaea sp.]